MSNSREGPKAKSGVLLAVKGILGLVQKVGQQTGGELNMTKKDKETSEVQKQDSDKVKDKSSALKKASKKKTVQATLPNTTKVKAPQVRKKANTSKAKGGAFERKICKQLSLWVSKGKQDDLFWRSAMSGGRATLGIQKGIVRKGQMGDVSAISKLGQVLIREFVIELKHVKNMNVESGILYGTKAGLRTYWAKLLEECNAAYKYPMLIGRSNNRPVLLITDLSTGSKLQNSFDAKIRRKKKKSTDREEGLAKVWSPNLKLCVFIFEEVIGSITFNEFMEVLHIRKVKRVYLLPKAQRGRK